MADNPITQTTSQSSPKLPCANKGFAPLWLLFVVYVSVLLALLNMKEYYFIDLDYYRERGQALAGKDFHHSLYGAFLLISHTLLLMYLILGISKAWKSIAPPSSIWPLGLWLTSSFLVIMTFLLDLLLPSYLEGQFAAINTYPEAAGLTEFLQMNWITQFLERVVGSIGLLGLVSLFYSICATIVLKIIQRQKMGSYSNISNSRTGN
jgi:hypothetical protein